MVSETGDGPNEGNVDSKYRRDEGVIGDGAGVGFLN